MYVPTRERRYELVAMQNVRLDGEPAKISNGSGNFAWVSTLPDGPSYCFSWATVEKAVMQRNEGTFIRFFS
jgi:hypothetical protein